MVRLLLLRGNRLLPVPCEERENLVATFAHRIEFLRFEAAERSFCVDVDQVVGIVTIPPSFREVPESVPFQNQEVPVYSLERLLELVPKPGPPPREILVLKGPGGLYGLSVDWVGEICKVPVQRCVFRFPASTHCQIRMFGIWGMAVLEKDLALILEPGVLVQEVWDATPGLRPAFEPLSTKERTAYPAGCRG